MKLGRNIATFVRFFSVLMALSLVTSHTVGQDEPALGDILVEEWNGVADSIRTCQSELKIYRKVFRGVDQFPIEELIKRLNSAIENKREREVLDELGKELFADMAKGKRPIWNFQVKSVRTPKSNYITMIDANGKLYERYIFGPLGFASHHPKMGQIQVNSSGNRERFTIEDTMFLPEFKSSKEIEIDEESAEGAIGVSWSNKQYTMTVDDEDFGVTQYQFKRDDRVTNGFNLGELKVNSFDFPVPRLIVVYSEEAGKPDTLLITLVNSVAINQKVSKVDEQFEVAPGTTVIDLRNGNERATFDVPEKAVPCVFEFVRETQEKTKEKNKRGKSDGRTTTDESVDGPDSDDLIPVVHIDVSNDNVLRPASNVLAFVLIALAATVVSSSSSFFGFFST